MSENSLLRILEKQKEVFKSGKTLDIHFRKNQLQKLANILKYNSKEITSAFREDFKKPFNEIRMEINASYSKVNDILYHIERWSRGFKIDTNFVTWNSYQSIVPQPFGSVLIISPWNFPIILFFEPLIGAIAAGNTVIIKHSELVPKLSLKLKELIETTLDKDCYNVIIEPDCGEELTKMAFDYVFFTGSTRVGKMVYQSVSKKLIPVTLELGGPCPCYVHHDADITNAAKKIVWIKTMNAGQLCVTVNHVFIHEKIAFSFMEEILSQFKTFFGNNIKESEYYGRIINKFHTNRLYKLIDESTDIKIFDGVSDIDENFIHPTVIHCKNKDDFLIKNEIFGPILPIYVVKDENEAISCIKSSSKPLQIYLFSYNNKVIQQFQDETISGTLTINETFLSMASPNLPFGGVGESGMGRYHGFETFKTFSNYRSIYKKKYNINILDNFVYPPYTKTQEKILDACESGEYSRACRIL